MSTSVIQIRVDEALKTKASQIYTELGIDISTAIRMFLKRTIIENGIPFQMILPKKTFNSNIGLQALSEINDTAEKVGIADISLEEINEEISKTRLNR